MKSLWWIPVIFLALLFQGSLSVLYVAPNLTALAVYFIGIRHGRTTGLLSGLFIGAVEDSLSSGLLGPHMLAKGIVGFFSASFVSGSLLIWTPLFGTIAAAFLTFADNTAAFACLSLFDKLPTHPLSALYAATMQSLINAPAGIFMRPGNAD